MFSRLGARAACLLALSFVALSARPEAQSDPSETRIKSAIVYRFTDYVEWPASALSGRKAFELCLVRPSALTADLAALVAGQTINSREFLVREVDPDDVLSSCHLVFVPAAVSRQGRALLQKLVNQPVLTVGDYNTFLADGGTIALRVVDGRIRFEVALSAAKRAKLSISSQLLRLALRVR